jgi:SAM-dependent methyltransferase
MTRSLDDLMLGIRGFQESRVLLTALELDLFTHVGTGATAAEVARGAGTEARATEMLLNALVALGALARTGDGYACTEASRALGPARAGLMHTVHLWNTWSTLTAAVQQGTSVVTPASGQTEAFIAAMHARARTEAAVMVKTVGADGVRSLLDVGGGSGAFALAFAAANPDLHATILDLGPVTEIAARHIAQAALQDRVRVQVGDLRTDTFEGGRDLVLLSAINHMLGEAENADLLLRCGRATRPGGRLVIREFILDPDRTGPKHAALFALNMLVGTKAGNTYTEAQYREWMEAAGFSDIVRPDPKGDIMIGIRG